MKIAMTKEEFIQRQPQTDEEKRLWEKIAEYERAYFEDMTLQPGSILDDFMWRKVEYDSSNQEEDWIAPDMGLGHNGYTVKIDDLSDGDMAVCEDEPRVIKIDSKYADDKIVVLHEMIHAYVGLFREGKPLMSLISIAELLLVRLYADLQIKIQDLDKRIINHQNMIDVEIFAQHGPHDLLFFLKSLDLDLRLKLPLGSVCSYGRDIT
jgi:hypothetical protein